MSWYKEDLGYRFGPEYQLLLRTAVEYICKAEFWKRFYTWSFTRKINSTEMRDYLVKYLRSVDDK